ncbi:MAG: sigma-54-dependent Fis family transcriptional regulator [Saprospiraceae bacterium]|nr:sigma-54-dependent Fis family transcriptional regulator [Saprospiraceae bacterium]
MQNLQSIKQRFGIIGVSKALDQALDIAVRVAATDLTVLITGESGVGKEVFSKIIHSISSRKHNPFIAINTGAIPPGTINSELFGHEKGSFTGATGDRKGYFETVNGGTIFLDEIGEMPLDTQAFLLRILESGEFIKVGSSAVMKTDVRVIAATNVDLTQKIKEGKFREDLFYRLNTVPIKVPSLKERKEDIPMLFRKFCLDFAEKYRSAPVRLDEQANAVLANYSWPGNIRELKNVAEQVSVLAQDKITSADDLVTIVPNLLVRNLPAFSRENESGSSSNGFYERELLYKLLFEMKKDITDLKGLIFELIRSNNLNISDVKTLVSLQPENYTQSEAEIEFIQSQKKSNFSKTPGTMGISNRDSEVDKSPTFIINHNQDDSYNNVEVMDDNMSLEDMEKDMINKALKKHHSKRKEAADDLGISERTLYRKIKQYDIPL